MNSGAAASPHQVAAAAAVFAAANNIQQQQQQLSVSPISSTPASGQNQMPPPTPNNFIYPWMRPTGNVKTSESSKR